MDAALGNGEVSRNSSSLAIGFQEQQLRKITVKTSLTITMATGMLSMNDHSTDFILDAMSSQPIATLSILTIYFDEQKLQTPINKMSNSLNTSITFKWSFPGNNRQNCTVRKRGNMQFLRNKIYYKAQVYSSMLTFKERCCYGILP